MHPVLKVEGVVPIWYYIPLCTIFAQQFNGDAFRTKYQNSKSRSQNPMPILKEDSITHQSGNPWWQPEDHSRIPITWPCRSWVAISIRIIPRAFSEAIQSLNQLSRHQVFQYSLDNTGVSQSTCMSLAQLVKLNLPVWEFNHTVHFQDGHNCIGPIQKIQLVIHLPG
ncbi:hypothetical protein O181_107693 [Austropuccinia psidii MF-1]|uniref:Uncharacterized protein n=1 Tax=Austropuccinia psidii MF-1 TaxID=1389203 RepID=A0A9Q3PN49_9BASI|nr:hypothetical protein [Austropuccinia psidii MF-1]